MKSQRPSGFPGLLIPLLAVAALAGAAPLAEALITSFHHDIYGIRTPAGMSNYAFLFSDQGFGYSLNLTFLWALLSTALGLAAALLLAGRLNNAPRKNSLLFGALLIPWGIPVFIAVPLWRVFFHGEGGTSLFSHLMGVRINLLTDPAAAFTAALWVSLWLTVPFAAFLLWGSLRKIPREQQEAARLDGAGEGALFIRILLPQIKGTLGILLIINFIKALKEFNVIYLMTSGGPPLISGITDQFILGATTTLEILIFEIFQSREDLGISAAYTVCLALIIIPVILVWYMKQKKPRTPYGPLSLVAGCQLLFNGPRGIVPAILYLLTGRRAGLLMPPLLAFHLLWMALRISQNGFLKGFDPGLILGLLIFLLFWLPRRSALRGSPKHSPFSEAVRRILSTFYPLISHLTAALFLLAGALMIYLLLRLSFSGQGTCTLESLLPPFPTLRNFQRVLGEETILPALVNTLKLSVAAALLTPLIVLPAAHHLLQAPRKQRFMLVTALYLMGLYGGMHSLIPLYALFRRLGLLGTSLPLVLIYVNHALPAALFASLAYLEKLPASLAENARLEGATSLQYLVRVVIPLSLPLLATQMILAFIGAWNGFMAPLLFLTREESFTISIKLFTLSGGLASGFPQWNIFAAASVINCLILFLIFFRFKNPLQHTALGD